MEERKTTVNMMDEEGDGVVENAKRKAATNATLNLSKKSSSKMKRVTWLLRKRQERKQLSNDEQKFLADNPKLVEQFNKRREKRQEYQSRHIEKEDSPETLRAKCAELAQALHDAEFLVVYTGAGISTSANIPDYRGPNGIWTRLQKGEDIGSHDLTEAEPTVTHMALAALQKTGRLQHIVSQNCDGLHLRSGLPKTALSEVHGNMYIEVCRGCVPAREYVRTFDVTERTSTYKHATGRRCYRCGEPLVDSIVHFGERGKLRWPLNWQGACQASNAADTILCLGSSLKVLKKYTWLWQMDRPARRRPRLYVVNLQWTPKDKEATMKINGKCDAVMKLVMDYMGIEIPRYNRSEDLIFEMATPLHPDELLTTTRPSLVPPINALASAEENPDNLGQNVTQRSQSPFCAEKYHEPPFFDGDALSKKEEVRDDERCATVLNCSSESNASGKKMSKHDVSSSSILSNANECEENVIEPPPVIHYKNGASIDKFRHLKCESNLEHCSSQSCCHTRSQYSDILEVNSKCSNNDSPLCISTPHRVVRSPATSTASVVVSSASLSPCIVPLKSVPAKVLSKTCSSQSDNHVSEFIHVSSSFPSVGINTTLVSLSSSISCSSSYPSVTTPRVSTTSGDCISGGPSSPSKCEHCTTGSCIHCEVLRLFSGMDGCELLNGDQCCKCEVVMKKMFSCGSAAKLMKCDKCGLFLRFFLLGTCWPTSRNGEVNANGKLNYGCTISHLFCNCFEKSQLAVSGAKLPLSSCGDAGVAATAAAAATVTSIIATAAETRSLVTLHVDAPDLCTQESSGEDSVVMLDSEDVEYKEQKFQDGDVKDSKDDLKDVKNFEIFNDSFKDEKDVKIGETKFLGNRSPNRLFSNYEQSNNFRRNDEVSHSDFVKTEEVKEEKLDAPFSCPKQNFGDRSCELEKNKIHKSFDLLSSSIVNMASNLKSSVNSISKDLMANEVSGPENTGSCPSEPSLVDSDSEVVILDIEESGSLNKPLSSNNFYGTGLCIRSSMDSCQESTSQEDGDEDLSELESVELETNGAEYESCDADNDDALDESDHEFSTMRDANDREATPETHLMHRVSYDNAQILKPNTDDSGVNYLSKRTKCGSNTEVERKRLKLDDIMEFTSGDSLDGAIDDASHEPVNSFVGKENDMHWRRNGVLRSTHDEQITEGSVWSDRVQSNGLVNKNSDYKNLSEAVRTDGGCFITDDDLSKPSKTIANGIHFKTTKSILNADTSELKAIWFNSFCDRQNVSRGDKSFAAVSRSQLASVLLGKVKDLVDQKQLLKGSDLHTNDDVKKLWFWGFDGAMIQHENGKQVIAEEDVKESVSIDKECAEFSVESSSDSEAENDSPPRRVTRSKTRSAQGDAGCSKQSCADSDETEGCQYCDGEMNPDLCKRSRHMVDSRLPPDDVMMRARAVIARRRNVNYKKYEPVFTVKLKSLTLDKNKKSKRRANSTSQVKEEKVHKVAPRLEENTHDQVQASESKDGENQNAPNFDESEKVLKKANPGWYGKGYRKMIRKRVPKSYPLK
ncbi:Sirtuin family [Trinorchestia longiramus]|nr:Sirtuin family [Trinorchestia longiramus]